MNKNDVSTVLVEFVSKELLDTNKELDLNENFENLSLGSIEIMEIIFFIEKEFKIKLDAEVFRDGNLGSLASLSEYVVGVTGIGSN